MVFEAMNLNVVIKGASVDREENRANDWALEQSNIRKPEERMNQQKGWEEMTGKGEKNDPLSQMLLIDEVIWGLGHWSLDLAMWKPLETLIRVVSEEW